VPAAANLVQYHPSDTNIWIERLVAKDKRRDSPGHAASINDQNYRRLEQGSKGCIAVAALQVQSVIKPFVAFDNTQFRMLHEMREAL